MHPDYFSHYRFIQSFDWSVFWVFATAVAAAVTAVATWKLWRVGEKQLTEINSTSKSDFLNELRGLFFNPTMRDIFMLLEYGALKFETKNVTLEHDKEKAFPYFSIDQKRLEQLEIEPAKKEELKNRKIFSAYEVDDFVLGILEDIASLEGRKLLKLDDVYDHFSWYLERLWENEEISAYVKQQRAEEEGGSDIYEGIERLYNEIQERDK